MHHKYEREKIKSAGARMQKRKLKVLKNSAKAQVLKGSAGSAKAQARRKKAHAQLWILSKLVQLDTH